MTDTHSNDNAASPVAEARTLTAHTYAPINHIRIGKITDRTETMVVRYIIGYVREGWPTAEPARKKAGEIRHVTHIADVTMPAMYVGSIEERDRWRRDAVLAHYGLVP